MIKMKKLQAELYPMDDLPHADLEKDTTGGLTHYE